VVNKYKVLPSNLQVFSFFSTFIDLLMRRLRTLFTLSTFFLVQFLSAQVPPPPPTGSPACWPPPCIPLDGGISILIAAGAAYGAKKLYDSRKKQDSVS